MAQLSKERQEAIYMSVLNSTAKMKTWLQKQLRAGQIDNETWHRVVTKLGVIEHEAAEAAIEAAKTGEIQ